MPLKIKLKLMLKSEVLRGHAVLPVVKTLLGKPILRMSHLIRVP